MSTDDTIPDDVRRFILLAIPSVPYLEALLLMRAAPAANWNAGAIAQRLYLADKTAIALLAELQAAAVVAPGSAPDSFVYAPASAGQRALIDRLAGIYAKNLVGVSTLIHSTSSRKAHQFANAFMLRKEP
jgi:hypothetical protein